MSEFRRFINILIGIVIFISLFVSVNFNTSDITYAQSIDCTEFGYSPSLTLECVSTELVNPFYCYQQFAGNQCNAGEYLNPTPDCVTEAAIEISQTALDCKTSEFEEYDCLTDTCNCIPGYNRQGLDCVPDAVNAATCNVSGSSPNQVSECSSPNFTESFYCYQKIGGQVCNEDRFFYGYPSCVRQGTIEQSTVLADCYEADNEVYNCTTNSCDCAPGYFRVEGECKTDPAYVEISPETVQVDTNTDPSSLGTINILTPDDISFILDERGLYIDATSTVDQNAIDVDGKICLGGVCRDSWPSGSGGGYWADGVPADSIYYDLGFVGVGDDDPQGNLDIYGTLCLTGDCIDEWSDITGSLDECSAPVFVGFTSSGPYDGDIGGYSGINNVCELEYPDSHICSTEEIMRSIRCAVPEILAGSGNGWLSDGPDSSSDDDLSNDCNAWTNDTENASGSVWYLNGAAGGVGYDSPCDQSRELMCCYGTGGGAGTASGIYPDTDWEGAGSGVMYPGIFTDQVGIGTVTPAGDLDVDGTICISGDCIPAWSNIPTDWSSNGNDIYYNTGNVGVNKDTPIGNLDTEGTVCISGDCITSWDDIQTLWTKSGDNIYYTAGFVGVGTDTPQGIVHIVGDTGLGGLTDPALEITGEICLNDSGTHIDCITEWPETNFLWTITGNDIHTTGSALNSDLAIQEDICFGLGGTDCISDWSWTQDTDFIRAKTGGLANNLAGMFTFASTQVNFNISGNTTGEYATVGGGQFNGVSATHGYVGGGSNNPINSNYGTVEGGYSNSVSSSYYGVIAGGKDNYIDGAADNFISILGGESNLVEDSGSIWSGTTYIEYATLVGGYDNAIYSSDPPPASFAWNARYSFLGGGTENELQGGDYSVIGGGEGHYIYNDPYSVIAGGYNSRMNGFWGGGLGMPGQYNVVSGGNGNGTGNAQYNTISGGGLNGMSFGSDGDTIGGGYNNNCDYFNSPNYWNDTMIQNTIAGGYGNTHAGGQWYSAIGGGNGNSTRNYLGNSFYNTIAGGEANSIANSSFSSVGGGYGNIIENGSEYTAAFGRLVRTTGTKYVMLFNGDNDPFFGATGVLCINRESCTNMIEVGTDTSNGNDAYLSAGGAWTVGSSRTFKENFRELDKKDIFNKIVGLEIKKWSYIDDQAYHIGPFAEDIYHTFNIGDSETYLADMDVSGVALVGVQALSENHNNLEEHVSNRWELIAALEEMSIEQEKEIDRLRSKIDKIK